MNERVASGLIVSWSGAFASVLVTQAHLWVGLLCGLMSLLATGYAIRVSRATLAWRRYQIEHQLCQDCRAGTVPVNCPIPAARRPGQCPLNQTPL